MAHIGNTEKKSAAKIKSLRLPKQLFCIFIQEKNQIVLFPALASNDTIGLLLPCRYQYRLLYSMYFRLGFYPYFVDLILFLH